MLFYCDKSTLGKPYEINCHGLGVGYVLCHKTKKKKEVISLKAPFFSKEVVRSQGTKWAAFGSPLVGGGGIRTIWKNILGINHWLHFKVDITCSWLITNGSFLNMGKQNAMSWIRHLNKLLFRTNLPAKEREEWWWE